MAGSEQKRLARIRAQRLAEEARIAEETARGVREDTGKKKSAPQEAAYGRVIHDEPIPMNEVTEDIGRMTVKGEVAALEMRDTKNGQSKIVTFSMTDHRGSVNCKLFLGGRRQSEDGSVEEQAEKLRAALKDGLWVKARGNYRYDDYKREMVLIDVYKRQVMGCVVNGPGEAKEADVGIAGGRDGGALFVKGQPPRAVHGDLAEILLAEIQRILQ